MLAKNYSQASMSRVDAARNLQSVQDIQAWSEWICSVQAGDENLRPYSEEEMDRWQIQHVKLRGNFQVGLKDFTPFFVTEDTTRLVLQAAMKMPGSMIVDLKKAPAMHGWIHLENALSAWADIETEENVPPVTFAAWTIDPHHKTVSIACFDHKSYPPRYVVGIVLIDGDQVGRYDIDVARAKSNNSIAMSWGNFLRVVYSLWLFCAQKIVIESSDHPNRAARRQEERARIKPQPVRIIQLRAKQRETFLDRQEGETEREHQKRMSRWMVEGHWRQQAVGPNWSEHRQVWINAHPAGNPDAPIRNIEKLYAVSR